MTAISAATRYVYDFADGSREMRVLLGGKGANIAEMTRVLGADLVPAGFTITTEACVAFMRDGRVEPAGLAEQVADGIARLEERAGRRLGDPEDPLLVSVRSGARDSMPGMLETILDLGLNDESVRGMAARTGDEHFAWDSYRRFVQMFGNVVRGVPGERYEEILRAARRRAGVREDRGLSVDAAPGRDTPLPDALRGAHRRDASRRTRRNSCGSRSAPCSTPGSATAPSPTAASTTSPTTGARRSTCSRWCSATCGAGSATGVAFSRDEVTGAPEPSGDFLLDAQGEDVVSGVRTPRPLHELAEELPDAHAQLLEILRTLEAHYGDMQDIEFTVERGRLYMLQTRGAKRPAQAAVRFAVDAVDEGLLTPRAGAARRSTPARSTRCCTRPSTPRRASRCWRAASRRRPARPRARSSSPPKRRSRPRPRAAT